MRLVAIVLLVSLACGGGQGGEGGFSPKSPCEVPRSPQASELDGLARYQSGGAQKALQVDVDGDRAPDLLVSAAGLCDRFGNCGYRIYLMRGQCGHALGAVWAHSARSGPPEARVLGDIIATTRDAKGEFEEWYQWKDSRYQCAALRERKIYVAGRLDPSAQWGPWESCGTP